MKILIATDTYPQQLNGVSRVLAKTYKELTARGHEVKVLSADDFKNFPWPGYKEVKIAIFPGPKAARIIEQFSPDAIHIMTEGPIGWAVRGYCRRRNIRFTTSWLSRLSEYVSIRYKIPLKWLHGLLRRFHNSAALTMVTTEGMATEARIQGIARVQRWRRGVELDKFRPIETSVFDGLDRPIMLNVGRVAIEKSLDKFLSLELPGTKVIVGDGPQIGELKRRFPEVVYLGVREGEALTECYSGADVFVFPSITDTFGLVNLESLACGLPVAAYPVTGPRDIIGDAPVGALHNNLKVAIERALLQNREDCIAHARTYSWDVATEDFISNLVPVGAIEALPVDT
ncbi:glycosyltransferase family 1 protein [Microbulbifer sp. OS29]|uniref:Glycosyltransferase family 1 protein n=1 Tax=Microbulbifer okhotskensis TaxID=2926617 RepID=A0A9X2J6Y9_9GAMM|nr:glycosyltransferase family 1 protein [Microbulbifer okhotskensis]MCO1335175.1 glycosyltransferase family 1 protein [Microbulbifer okhotskensis]